MEQYSLVSGKYKEDQNLDVSFSNAIMIQQVTHVVMQCKKSVALKSLSRLISWKMFGGFRYYLEWVMVTRDVWLFLFPCCMDLAPVWSTDPLSK